MLLTFSKISRILTSIGNSGLTLKVDDDTIEQGIVDIKGSCKLYRAEINKSGIFVLQK